MVINGIPTRAKVMADRKKVVNQLVLNYMRNAGIRRSHTIVNILLNNEDSTPDFIVRLLMEEDTLFNEVLISVMPTMMSFIADNGNPFRGNDTMQMRESMDYLLFMDTEMFRCQLRISKRLTRGYSPH